MSVYAIPDPAYRIWRLRRLLGVQAGAVACGAILGLSLGALPAVVFWGAVVTLALCTYLALRLPHGWAETLQLALVGAGTLACAPYWQGGTGAQILTVPMIAFGTWFLSVSLVANYLPGLGRRTRRLEYGAFFPHPVARVWAHFVPQPGARVENRSYGQPDENGLIPVRFELPKASRTTAEISEALEAVDETYFMRVMEQEEGRLNITQYTQPLPNGEMISTVVQESFTDVEGGTRYFVVEVFDLYDIYTAFGGWLTDFTGDSMTAAADALDALPTRALKAAPLDTPMSVIACSMAGDTAEDHL
ncbi:hypothetical protein IV417_15265 [Alphaproteobacteria bacterium KMM 3653]|uniref:Uncharacterized protein n=1 Tax=Harenicola maris TaxID=2841044 RepID=A0AAP2CRF0_9RHOB|nr:hypothetical protein [Harenicola maris]